MPADLPTLTPPAATAWSQFLHRSAYSSQGVWLTLAKKGVTHPTSLTYAQALDEALCHGWIDGQARGGDEKTYSQRFTPRTKTSNWSKRNVGIVERLEAEGRMRERGRLEMEKAKADGRWEAAYAGQATMEPSAELAAAIAEDAEVQVAWDALSRQERYLFCHRLAVLKTEAGRRKRIAATVEALRGGSSSQVQKGNGGVTAAVAASATSSSIPPSRVEKGVRRSSRRR